MVGNANRNGSYAYYTLLFPENREEFFGMRMSLLEIKPKRCIVLNRDTLWSA